MSPNAPLIGVLALQGAVAEHERALNAAGARSRLVRRPAQLAELDGLVMPGGESTAIARMAARVGLMHAIRERHAQGMAVFGTCAGLILMAESISDPGPLKGFDRFGGLGVQVRRNGYGSQMYSFEDRLDVVGLAAPLSAVFIRAPIIEQITGEDVEILAQAQEKPVAVRQGRLLATSFHPELTGDTRLHRLFAELSA